MIGKEVGNYHIQELIGKGGMAVVYRGQHRTLSRRIVAIKMLSTELEKDPSFSERFFREAEVMDRLRHPNIVTLYDFIAEQNHFFIVMEYVEGITLDGIIKKAEKPIHLDQVKTVFAQVLDAIGYAHKLGIVHRDLKPSNIMINKEGQVKITDFGIARLLAENFEATLTTTGLGIGSPYYMSPEQVLASKEHPITAASDVYSLGITLFQMVTGKVPFSKKDSLFTILQAHLSTAPPSPREFSPEIPVSLEKVILKAIEKKPEHRWKSCEEFWKMLDKALSEQAGKATHVEQVKKMPPSPPVSESPVPVAAEKPPVSMRKDYEPSTGRHWLKVLLSIILLIAVAGAGSYFYREYKIKEKTSSVLPSHKKEKKTAEIDKKLSKAEGFLKKGRFDKAMSIAGEVLKEDPGNKNAISIREKAQEAKKGRDLEEKRKEQILANLTSARNSLDKKEFKKASRFAKQVLAVDSENEEAKKIYEQAQEGAKRQFLDKKLAEGYAHLKEKKYSLALKDAQTILETYPGDPDALQLKDKVKSAKEKIEEEKTNKVNIALIKAEAYLDSGNYEKARGLAVSILDTDPKNERARAVLAEAREGAKRTFIDNKLAKGKTYMEARAYTLALKEAKKILKAYPDEPRAIRLKEEAILHLKKAREEKIAKKEVQIGQYFKEGKKFFNLGKYEQSILSFREVLRIDPTNKEAKSWLKRAQVQLDAVRKAWATGGGEYKVQKKDEKGE